MALKERIPSPTDIANQVANKNPNVEPIKQPEPTKPTSTSSTPSKEPTKFTPEEIKEIQTLQTTMNQLVYRLGQLKLSEIKLEHTKKLMDENLIQLEKKEAELAKNLNKKYGKGTLDIETGTFHPTK